MRREYPNPLGTGLRFNFLSPLDMDRVTGKYMGVGDEDGKAKHVSTPPHCHAYLHGLREHANDITQ